MLGPDTVLVDQLIRLLAGPRATERHLKHIRPDEEVLLENYSAGINKVAENLVVYPPEFAIVWSNFEPWTPKDSIALGHLMF